MPFDAFAQLEGDRLAVRRAFPGGGEARRKAILAVEGCFRKRLDHLAGDEEDAVRGDDRGVEVLGLGIGCDDQTSTGGRRLSKRESRKRGRCEQKTACLQKG